MIEYLRLLRRIIYWALPVIILYVIFQQIDLNEFIQNLKQANIVLIIFGVILCPATMLLGGLRWHLLAREYNQIAIPLSFSLQHYWMGFPIGVFVPGSLGWDAYRIIAVGRRFGQYVMNAVAILAEKFIALLGCAVMIFVLYPFVPLDSTSHPITYIVIGSCCILFLYLLVIVSIKIARSRTRAGPIFVKLEKKIFATLNRILLKVSRNVTKRPATVSLWKMLRPMMKLRSILILIGLTIGMQFISASFNQLFFVGLDYDLPFIVNLFIAPILFFIYVLPISFGSIGVREGAHIILYGFFGVPAETALLVSFFALSGLMLNNLIGGILIWFFPLENNTNQAMDHNSKQSQI